MRTTYKFIIASAVACIIACIGEFVSIFVLGLYYPGYNQLKDTMSSLGASASPVSNIISLWWWIMGVLIIFFGIGVRNAFTENKPYTKLAAWLFILYGFGEGIGSGAFKADHLKTGLTISAYVHNALGGIGVISILLLPLIMKKVITKIEAPYFYRISQIIFITGIITIFLFLFRFLPEDNNFFSIYKGLWQRLFMLNTYIYFTYIAIFIIKQQRKFNNKLIY